MTGVLTNARLLPPPLLSQVEMASPPPGEAGLTCGFCESATVGSM